MIRQLATTFVRDRELVVVPVSGPTASASLINKAGSIRLLNDTLVLLNDRRSLTLRNLRTNQDRLLYTGNIWDRGVTLSADGKSIAVSIAVAGIDTPLLIDLTTGSSKRVPYSLGGEIAEVQVHPDGRHLVVYACRTCVEPNYVEKWDIVLVPINGDPARVLTASQASYKDHGFPSISPDGRTIAFEGEVSYNTRIVRLTVPTRR